MQIGMGISLTNSSEVPAWYLAGGAPAPVQVNRFRGKASFAAAKTNEITPGTLDLIDGANAPSWASATGALFNDGDTNSQYLRTGVTNADGNVTLFVTFTVNANTPNNCMFGIYDTGTLFIQRNTAAGTLVFCNGDVITVVGGAILSGTHTLCIAGTKAYLDGVVVAGTLTSDVINIEIFLGSLNFGGTSVQSCGSYITHWAFWRSILTAPQVAAVHARAYAEATAP